MGYQKLPTIFSAPDGYFLRIQPCSAALNVASASSGDPGSEGRHESTAEETERVAEGEAGRVEGEMLTGVTSKWSCSSCKGQFASLAHQREHFKTDWHIANVKRVAAGKPPMTEADFGNASEDEEAEDDYHSEEEGEEEEEDKEGEEGGEVGRGSKDGLHTHFKDGDGREIRLWRCVLAGDAELARCERANDLLLARARGLRGESPEQLSDAPLTGHFDTRGQHTATGTVGPSDRGHQGPMTIHPSGGSAAGVGHQGSQGTDASGASSKGSAQGSSNNSLQPGSGVPGCEGASGGEGPLWLIALSTGGHFAAALLRVKGGDVVAHNSFHRYVVRAKAGGRQSTKDNAAGAGHAPKSAGSTLRRYNEAALDKEIQDLLSGWKATRGVSISAIFLHAPGQANKRAIFAAANGFSRDDPRLRTVPFPVRRASYREVLRVARRLAFLERVIADDSTSADAAAGSAGGAAALPADGAQVAADARSQGSAPSNGWAKGETGAATATTAAASSSIKALPRSHEQEDDKLRGASSPDVDAAAAERAAAEECRKKKAFDKQRRQQIKEHQEEKQRKAAEEAAAKAVEGSAVNNKAPGGAVAVATVPSATVPHKASTPAERPTRSRGAGGGGMAAALERARASQEAAAKIQAEAEQAAAAAEREIRAAAAERRRAGMSMQQGGAKAAGVCASCGTSLAGKIPFHRLNFSYCTTGCVQEHKRSLEGL
eukprot:jgi/Mesvir1/10274/Mv07823-RA.2